MKREYIKFNNISELGEKIAPYYWGLQIYKTNRPKKCRCGCSGDYIDLEHTKEAIEKALQEYNLKIQDIKFYEVNKANEDKWKVPSKAGYYDYLANGTKRYFINLGRKDHYNHNQLIIEFEK